MGGSLVHPLAHLTQYVPLPVVGRPLHLEGKNIGKEIVSITKSTCDNATLVGRLSKKKSGFHRNLSTTVGAGRGVSTILKPNCSIGKQSKNNKNIQ